MILIKVEHQDFNTINFARTDFDSFVDWAVQESTSAVINRDEQMWFPYNCTYLRDAVVPKTKARLYASSASPITLIEGVDASYIAVVMQMSLKR